LDLPQQLTSQLKGMERLVDGQTGSILFRHPELRGIPDLVVEGDGYTMEFIGSKLLCPRCRLTSWATAVAKPPLNRSCAGDESARQHRNQEESVAVLVP